MELRESSLAEIRRQLREGAAVTRSLVAALEQDPREGARALARALALRRARARRERARLAALFREERALLGQGAGSVAGVDEVGVGPLAGPVVAAAVVLPSDAASAERLAGLDDSKRLSPRERARLDVLIRSLARAVSIGWATPAEIDRRNVYQAALLAMQRAVIGLEPPPDVLLVDARTIPGVALPQRALIGGDARVASIAAASIVAKVYRDAWMRDLDRRYPGYGFADHAGYGTESHRSALERLGPCPAHRFSFAPVRDATRARRAESWGAGRRATIARRQGFEKEDPE